MSNDRLSTPPRLQPLRASNLSVDHSRIFGPVQLRLDEAADPDGLFARRLSFVPGAHEQLATVNRATQKFVEQSEAGGETPDLMLFRTMLYYTCEYPQQVPTDHRRLEEDLIQSCPGGPFSRYGSHTRALGQSVEYGAGTVPAAERRSVRDPGTHLAGRSRAGSDRLHRACRIDCRCVRGAPYIATPEAREGTRAPPRASPVPPAPDEIVCFAEIWL